jgi:hypothetical protein
MFSGLKFKSIALLFLVLISLVAINTSHQSYSFFFEPRSVQISNGTPLSNVSHDFSLTPVTAGNVGSLVFEYCSNSPLVFVACNPPAGLDVSGAALVSQSGNVGFIIDNADSTVNKIVLTRASSPVSLTASTYNFNNIINPSTPGQTVYVRLANFASTDGSGSLIDKGAVAFAVQSIFNIGAFVPPFLRLCVAITVNPDCSFMSGDSINLGLLSSTKVRYAQSQFSTATNDTTGYNVFAVGNTMTSGSNTIPALAAPTPSFPGTGQFGMNLRANLIPPVGQNPVGTGTASPTANYNITNRYMFNSGDAVASSTINTNYNRMTVSYIANVPSTQTPGVYATTITYIATVQF